MPGKVKKQVKKKKSVKKKTMYLPPPPLPPPPLPPPPIEEVPLPPIEEVPVMVTPNLPMVKHVSKMSKFKKFLGKHKKKIILALTLLAAGMSIKYVSKETKLPQPVVKMISNNTDPTQPPEESFKELINAPLQPTILHSSGKAPPPPPPPPPPKKHHPLVIKKGIKKNINAGFDNELKGAVTKKRPSIRLDENGNIIKEIKPFDEPPLFSQIKSGYRLKKGVRTPAQKRKELSNEVRSRMAEPRDMYTIPGYNLKATKYNQLALVEPSVGQFAHNVRTIAAHSGMQRRNTLRPGTRDKYNLFGKKRTRRRGTLQTLKKHLKMISRM
jgi:hypothetical protein